MHNMSTWFAIGLLFGLVAGFTSLAHAQDSSFTQMPAPCSDPVMCADQEKEKRYGGEYTGGGGSSSGGSGAGSYGGGYGGGGETCWDEDVPGTGGWVTRYVDGVPGSYYSPPAKRRVCTNDPGGGGVSIPQGPTAPSGGGSGGKKPPSNDTPLACMDEGGYWDEDTKACYPCNKCDEDNDTCLKLADALKDNCEDNIYRQVTGLTEEQRLAGIEYRRAYRYGKPYYGRYEPNGAVDPYVTGAGAKHHRPYVYSLYPGYTVVGGLVYAGDQLPNGDQCPKWGQCEAWWSERAYSVRPIEDCRDSGPLSCRVGDPDPKISEERDTCWIDWARTHQLCEEAWVRGMPSEQRQTAVSWNGGFDFKGVSGGYNVSVTYKVTTKAVDGLRNTCIGMHSSATGACSQALTVCQGKTKDQCEK